MKIKKLLESAVLASVILLTSTTGHAAVTSIFLDIAVVGGDFDGTTGTGVIGYDKNDVSGATTTLSFGSGALNSGTFSLALDIFGQGFFGSDATTSPTLNFSGDDVSQLNFSVDSGITQSGIDGFSFFDGLTFTGFDSTGSKPIKVYAATVNTTVVPLPASAWLFVSGLIGLVGMQRRKS